MPRLFWHQYRSSFVLTVFMIASVADNEIIAACSVPYQQADISWKYSSSKLNIRLASGLPGIYNSVSGAISARWGGARCAFPSRNS